MKNKPLTVPKILAPAGGRGAFDAALRAGADEIYMGLVGYGARQSAANFTTDEFCRALDDAHTSGVTVHLTFNTVMSAAEIERAAPDIARLDASGLDAVIVQDLGAAEFLRENFPHLALHASTQMALANSADVLWAENFGMSRVVLPRELTADELSIIRSASTVELEVFVSGALCQGCSGRCYLSSFIGGRSGNRGMCAQPCRQSYQTVQNTKRNPDGTYLLSLRDQLMGPEEIARLTQLGINALKIEGRMKSPPYVFEAVRYYRRILDSLAGVSEKLLAKLYVLKGEELPKDGKTVLPAIFNRGYSKGFFYESDPNILHPEFASSLGEKIAYVNGGALVLTSPVRCGDGVVYLDAAHNRLGGGNVSKIERLSSRPGGRLLLVDSAHVGDRVRLDGPPPLGAVDLYRSYDHDVVRSCEHAFENTRRHRPISVRLTAKVGSPLRLELAAGEVTAAAVSMEPLARSIKRKTSAEEIKLALDRFGQTNFVPTGWELDFDDDVFLPKSVLNSVRQQASDRLYEVCRLAAHRPMRTPGPFLKQAVEETAEETPSISRVYAAAVRTAEQAEAVYRAGIRLIYPLARPVLFQNDYLLAKSLAFRERFILPGAEGAIPFFPLVGTLAEAAKCQEQECDFAADWCFNITNVRSALVLLERFSRLKTLYLSPELSAAVARELCDVISPIISRRGGRVGLSVYGALAGMTTRVTLFPEETLTMVDREERKFTVVKNSSWFTDRAADKLSGSTLYYRCHNDIRSAERIASLAELRYDFTIETPEEIERILTRIPPIEDSYGFIHPIF